MSFGLFLKLLLYGLLRPYDKSRKIALINYPPRLQSPKQTPSQHGGGENSNQRTTKKKLFTYLLGLFLQRSPSQGFSFKLGSADLARLGFIVRGVFSVASRTIQKPV